MRCYYEILGVPKNAEAAELKKAYYKMSLQWHPDKTSASENDTTKIFQEIQEAYRVLSDPHERAWYDSHRAQILRSGGVPTGAQQQFEEERLDVFKYFTRSCFEAFDDGPKGFYTIYRKVFEDLAEEELRASDDNLHDFGSSSDNNSEDSVGGGRNGLIYPTFGSSTSSYTDVVAPFYRFWEMFQTRKSYTWVEKYDTRIAESRQERRAMETENRRLRNTARKKRNEEIRELVSFVKKRDKRVAAERERIEIVNQEAHARSKELSKQTRLRNATELENAWIEEQQHGGIGAQWTVDFEAELRRIESELDQTNSTTVLGADQVTEENSDLLSDDSSDCDRLYCAACDKYFASIKARQNHNASKKHRKQVELLRQVLQEEELQANCDPLSDSGPEDLQPTSGGEVKLTKRAKKAQRKRLREAERQNVDKLVEDQDDLVECVESTIIVEDTETARSPTNRFSPNAKKPQAPQSHVLLCESCHAEFSSRNKLFAHLKETNHATLKVASKGNKNKSRTKK